MCTYYRFCLQHCRKRPTLVEDFYKCHCLLLMYWCTDFRCQFTFNFNGSTSLWKFCGTVIMNVYDTCIETCSQANIPRHWPSRSKPWKFVFMEPLVRGQTSRTMWCLCVRWQYESDVDVELWMSTASSTVAGSRSKRTLARRCVTGRRCCVTTRTRASLRCGCGATLSDCSSARGVLPVTSHNLGPAPERPPDLPAARLLQLRHVMKTDLFFDDASCCHYLVFIHFARKMLWRHCWLGIQPAAQIRQRFAFGWNGLTYTNNPEN